MKGGEAKFWNRIRVALDSIGFADRIESHATSSGIPDVHFAVEPGIHWFIELKYCDAGKVKLRATQRGWFYKMKKTQGKAFVFTKVVNLGKEFYMIHMPWDIPKGDDLVDWENSAYLVWDDFINWSEFEEVIRGQVFSTQKPR